MKYFCKDDNSGGYGYTSDNIFNGVSSSRDFYDTWKDDIGRVYNTGISYLELRKIDLNYEPEMIEKELAEAMVESELIEVKEKLAKVKGELYKSKAEAKMYKRLACMYYQNVL